MILGVIDYGLSNLFSVVSALRYLNFDYKIISDVDENSKDTDLIIIPGVSSFGPGMQSLKNRGQDEFIRLHNQKHKPILGLCFGAQILLQASEESPGVEGFNFVPGKCSKLQKSDFRVPNQGWREISTEKSFKSAFSLLKSSPQYCFFSHSYKMVLENEESIIMHTNSSAEKITAAYEYKNIFGIQFHPERSGTLGLRILNSAIKRLGSAIE